MLNMLKLENYRGFQRHTIMFKPVTVLVGRNNAGKSTIVEALRLISIVTERIEGLNFSNPPSWTGLPLYKRGVRPALDGMGIDFRTVCFQYADPPAIITAGFAGGERIEFYLDNTSDCHVVLFDCFGHVIRSKGQVRAANFPKLHVLPQVAPLEPDEVVLSNEYVKKNLSSPLAPRHFRNQLRLFVGSYKEFRALAEATWPTLQIQTLEGARGLPGTELFLAVRDKSFVGEVSCMGHGLQMWLQTMWFLARTPNEASVVLDEPDVYMHPDLQRKMIRIVKNRFAQAVVATHSVEIMAEVSPSEIVIIDKDRPESTFANSDPAVQGLVERLGGVHNVHLARLWDAKRCLFVEGKDIQYLKLLYDLLHPSADRPLDGVPNMSIGGWAGWKYAIGSSLFIRNSVGQSVSAYCILDSDYHTREEIRGRIAEATQMNVRLHIWKMKEIENYLLLPAAIARIIGGRSGRPVGTAVEGRVREKIEDAATGMKDEVLDNYANEIYLADKRAGLQAANRGAREIVESAFGSPEGRTAVVSGKKVIGIIAQWAQTEFGVSLGAGAIAREMNKQEVNAEVGAVLAAIHNNRRFAQVDWKRSWESG